MAQTIAQEVAAAKKAAADRAKATAAAVAREANKKPANSVPSAKTKEEKKLLEDALALRAKLEARLAKAEATQASIPGLKTQAEADLAEATAIAKETKAAAEIAAAEAGRTVPWATPEVVDPVEAAKDKILVNTMQSYGMAGIGSTVAMIRSQNPKISSEDLLFLLKNDPRYNAEYLKRFPGNAKLKAQGLPTIDDATYLSAEKEYEKTFKAYGATGLANRDYYGTLIANKMDLGDVTDRLNLAYTRLKSTPDVKKAFGQFYSAVTDGDILAAMLDPTTQVPLLEKKVVAAEIGGAALAQNLQTSLVSATDLQAYGVTRATAQVGYAEIAPKLKRGKFLTQIAPETGVDYTQKLAEDIQFKKSAAAKEQEERVISAELSKWGGSPGAMSSKAFASQQRGAGLI